MTEQQVLQVFEKIKQKCTENTSIVIIKKVFNYGESLPAERQPEYFTKIFDGILTKEEIISLCEPFVCPCYGFSGFCRGTYEGEDVDCEGDIFKCSKPKVWEAIKK